MTVAFPRRRVRALDARLAGPSIRPRAHGPHALLVLLAIFVAAGPLGGQARVAPSARIAPAGRCVDSVATVTPARLDAKHLIYVEQQTVVSQRDGRVLVAGRPVFVWRDEGDRYEMLKVDSLFGMVVDSISSSVRGIPSPFPGTRLEGIRAAALPDGWWLTTFAEVFPAKMPNHPIVKQMWTGETDGTRWRRVRKLPTLADSMDTMDISALVYRDGRARLAALAPRGGFKYAEIYSLDHDRWTVRSENLRLTTYVNLSLSPTHDLMAVVRPSEKDETDENSLFLFAKRPEDSTWTQKAWIVVAGARAVHDPRFSGSTPRVLSWSRTTDDGADWDAWFATVDDRGDSIGPVTRVGPGAIELAVASQGAHHVWATFDRARLTRPTLRLADGGGSSDLSLLETVTDYAGLIGVAIARGRVIVIVSLPSSNPRDPQVISVVRTHTWRCP